MSKGGVLVNTVTWIVSRVGSNPYMRKSYSFSHFRQTYIHSSRQANFYHSREMSEQPGVRARRQPERLHPGNHLKNRADTFTNALVVIAEEPESAESQEERKYSDLDFDGLFSGEIFLRTSLTQCNNGKNKRRPETLQVNFYHNNDSAESKE